MNRFVVSQGDKQLEVDFDPILGMDDRTVVFKFVFHHNAVGGVVEADRDRAWKSLVRAAEAILDQSRRGQP